MEIIVGFCAECEFLCVSIASMVRQMKIRTVLYVGRASKVDYKSLSLILKHFQQFQLGLIAAG